MSSSTVCPITSLEQFSSNLRSLSRTAAQQKLLLRQVGSQADCPKLRGQLDAVSARLLGSLVASKEVILAAMRGRQGTAAAEEAAGMKEWEARYTTFVQLAERAAENLATAVSLLSRFPLRQDAFNTRIFVGIAEFFGVERRSMLSLSGSLKSSRRSSVSSSLAGGSGCRSPETPAPLGEDSQLLNDFKQQMASARALAEQLQSAVIVAHWTVEHRVDCGDGGSSDGSFEEDSSKDKEPPHKSPGGGGVGGVGGSGGGGGWLCMLCR